MKHWVLFFSLFVLGCSGGESGSSEETAETVGADIADSLNDAQDKAANVEVLLEESKRDVDAALEEAEKTDND